MSIEPSPRILLEFSEATNCMLPPASSGWRELFQRSWMRPIAQVHRERGSRAKIRKRLLQRGRLTGHSKKGPGRVTNPALTTARSGSGWTRGVQITFAGFLAMRHPQCAITVQIILFVMHDTAGTDNRN